ncbi:hypothetical protein [Burkholderia vietnamiensis]|uniref:hypothetical protein n=1 Tax=Burkholderia vietnamiensis TaxID=60552 RepID=UPI001594AE62|nr:hypothetical protein [Burkholderia vietnamiensis]MCA7943283.1 hypothetical protein [Burkholderia vietnamiensis]HDR8974003.1 hypothetical protein [Burkholderia vietnamiensis]HDR9142383.1 hypothetical protein [Burkholderia vietnamiensis]
MKITDDMLTEEGLRKLLSDVWNLGQTYWRQADSEFASDNRRSDDTYKKYRAIVDESCERLADAARRTTPDREAIIEECAKVCDDRIMGDQSEGDFESKRCAEAIRSLKTSPTTSPRDTLIEEVAEMVDHMGEGRRLEEYVGAIREMKSSDKGGA